jgi:hypothetical protein
MKTAATILIIFLIVVAAVFFATQPGQAHQHSIDIARSFWKRDPPCGHTVYFLRRDLGRNPLGEVGGEADVKNCIIYLDDQALTGPFRCAIIVHEYGHLIGRVHNNNPRSVMYPIISPNNIPRACQ